LKENAGSVALVVASARSGRVKVLSLRKIVTGTALVSSASLVRILAQFIALPILSRLLTSTDYGLVAIALPFIVFAMLITDAGIGMSLVRSVPLEDEVIWSTSFWLVLALGTGLAVILAALAPLAAYVFSEPRLELIWVVLALTIGAQAAAVIPGAALQQARRFSTIATIEITSILLGIAAAVIAGFLGAGVWALVTQQIVFFITRVILTLVCSPFRPRLIFSLAKIKSHLAFGRDVLSVNMVAHFSGSIDNLVIGHVLGPASVGFYSMAMQFVRLPTVVVTGPLQFVLYSHMATIRDDLPAIRRVFLLVTRVLAIIVFPSLGMVAAAHFSTFNILLSEKWSQSSTIFMILSAAGAVQAMMALGGDIMLILGRSDLRLRTTVEFSLIWLCALVLSVSYDIYWVAVMYNCAVLLYLPRTLRLVLSLIQCPLKTYLEAMLVPALATLASIVLYEEIVESFTPQKYADVGLAALLAVVTIAISALVQLRPLLHESALLALPFRSNPAVR
jgi:O-antigen/teichoic acid export membrane protein